MRLPSRWGNLAPLLVFGLLLVLMVQVLVRPRSAGYAPLSAYFNAGASVPQVEVTPLTADQVAVIQRSDADWATAQIDLVLESEVYRAELPALASELQTALDYVQERTGIALAQRLRLVLGDDGSCGFHGVTYSDVRVVRVYSCAGVPRSRIVNLAAHEFVHQLEQDRYGAPHLSADLILSEGFATWGAGRYWLGGNPDFASFARQYRADGSALPLATHYAGLGVGAMNVLYYQWAAFVDYLLATYGRERFDALYVSGGAQQPGAASYASVYDQDLPALEAAWQRWLDP